MPIRTESFTTYYKGRANILINEVSISKAHIPNKGIISPLTNSEYCNYKALWDTGATHTVITKKVAEDCQLQPTGMKKVFHAAGETDTNTYLINVRLASKVEVCCVNVTEGVLNNDIEALIGMDIIGMGDFAVSNKDGITIFSYRFPSVEHIDFVKNPFKEIPVSVEKKPERNDPCPCGSGKKYKKCCGQ